MCDELGLSFGRCTEDAKAMLKKEGNENPTTAQLKKALDKIEDKHHAIIFLYKADKARYGKYIKQLENNMLEKKKDPFPKTLAGACQILAGWQNVYGNSPSLWRQMMESLLLQPEQLMTQALKTKKTTYYMFQVQEKWSLLERMP